MAMLTTCKVMLLFNVGSCCGVLRVISLGLEQPEIWARVAVAENFGARPDSITTSPFSCPVANGHHDHGLGRMYQLPIDWLQQHLEFVSATGV
jgi:hypothetical protein